MQTSKTRHGRGVLGAKRRRFSQKSRPVGGPSGYRGGFHGRRGGSSDRSSKRGGKIATFNPKQFINTTPVEHSESVYEPRHGFADFGLSEVLVKRIAALGLTTPTPIQDQVVPEMLQGKDVIGIAETGTGKTAAFLLPLIDHTLQDKSRQTLIMAPTRELAIQIEAELQKFTRGLGIFSVVCVGGANIRPQIYSLRKHNHFIIGTPGRLLDLLERRHLDTRKISTVILDEADRMLDMGFIKPIRTIFATIPSAHSTHFFSATMDARVRDLVQDFLKDPVTISVKKKEVTNSIKQDVVHFEHHEKYEKLTSLLADPAFRRVIIFGSMKHSVEKLATQLRQSGINADSIHGNKNHSQRQRALTGFKSGHTRVLVATDVAARGVHVDNVSHVINYDLPNTFEDYVHRIGRTGRGNSRGEALTFVPAE